MRRLILTSIVMVSVALCCMSCTSFSFSDTPKAPKVKATRLERNIVSTVIVDYTDVNDFYQIEDTGSLYVTEVDGVNVLTSKSAGLRDHILQIIEQRNKNLEIIQDAYSDTMVTGVSADSVVSDNLVTTVRVDSSDIYDNYPIYLNSGYYEAVVDSVLVSTPVKEGEVAEIEKVMAQRKAHLALLEAYQKAHSSGRVPEPPSMVSAKQL